MCDSWHPPFARSPARKGAHRCALASRSQSSHWPPSRPSRSARSAPQLGSDETQAAQQKRGGHLRIARQEDSTSFDKTNVFQNESIWLIQQINESLYTVGPGRQDPEALAGDELQGLEERQEVHHQAAQGRPLLEREGDDRGGRQVLVRRRARAGPGLGVPRRRHQERPGAQPLDGRLQPQVPVGAVPLRHRLLRKRDHPQELRRPEAGRVLQAPDRHWPVHVGQAGGRPVGELQAQSVLLAEGQAVPRPGDVDVRLRPEHPRAAAARRADRDQRVPALQLDQEAPEHAAA